MDFPDLGLLPNIKIRKNITKQFIIRHLTGNFIKIE
jgi:hypothetical protein